MRRTSLPMPAERRHTPLRICLTNMPFASSRRPSIQLGLLQSILARHRISAMTKYFNLELGAHLGWELYEELCHARDMLLGEWLFARAAFGQDAPRPETYLARHRDALAMLKEDVGLDAHQLIFLRETVLPAFVDECLETTDWSAFELVGFSSIFEQNCAALALARRIKRRWPAILTVFGGANFEDEMGLEYVRAIPWIDYAVIGEADEVFPAMIDRLSTGDDPTALPGVAQRVADGTVRFRGRAPQVRQLDVLPEPDYADYFDAAGRLNLPGQVRGQVVAVPFESARGCWWGQHQHCTFCGLNGLSMNFRSKSPRRVIDGLNELALRYQTYAFLSVDNILDPVYLEQVFPSLVEDHLDYTFFFEVKANLTREQLKSLAQGGVRILQPGIESLDTHILKLMRKGSTALQNVRFLKWGLYYDITVTWNLLLGFPGEKPEDYQKQATLIPKLHHLCPPGYVGRIRLDRFSPNFTDSTALGFSEVLPLPAYADVYPKDIDLGRVAYSFAYTAVDTLPDEAYADVKAAAQEWQVAWQSREPPGLAFQRGAERLTITDTRSGSTRIHSFGELAAQIYEAITPNARTVGRVQRFLREQYGHNVAPSEIQVILTDFCDLDLALVEGGYYLGLALPLNRNW